MQEREDQAPFCFTAKTFPPITINALRLDGPGLVATEKLTVPLPIPTLIEVIVIHASLATIEAQEEVASSEGSSCCVSFEAATRKR